MSLGLLHQLEGKVQEACADYEKALTADPSNAKAKQLFSLAVEQFSMIMYSVCKQTISGLSLTLFIELVALVALQSLRQSSYISVDRLLQTLKLFFETVFIVVKGRVMRMSRSTVAHPRTISRAFPIDISRRMMVSRRVSTYFHIFQKNIR